VTLQAGGSRTVDASTSRLQLCLEAPSRAELDALLVTAQGRTLQMATQPTPAGVAQVIGLRFRSFVPLAGLHPTLGADGSVELELRHGSGRGLRVAVHGWRPDGEAYEGLPAEPKDAAERRRQRVVVAAVPASELSKPVAPPTVARSEHCLDLRRC
jgi:uncharacterized protein (DUF2126 family)